MKDPNHFFTSTLMDFVLDSETPLGLPNGADEVVFALREDLLFLAQQRTDFHGLADQINQWEHAVFRFIQEGAGESLANALDFMITPTLPTHLCDDIDFDEKYVQLIGQVSEKCGIRDYNSLSRSLHRLLAFYLKLGVKHLPVFISENRIQVGRHTKVSFVRTLRIPEDGKTHPLPAGFGRLPLYRIEDYSTKVPEKWRQEGGFFIPLYQREALYLEFEGADWRPSILKVAVGKVNAVTGEVFDSSIRKHSQDYVVIPDQQWLDGINKGNGVVGQFVAMPLGKGYTVEEQVTDEAKHGGFQLMAYDAHEKRFPDVSPGERARRNEKYHERHPVPTKAQPAVEADLAELPQTLFSRAMRGQASVPSVPPIVEMGIAAGGSIDQKVVADKHGSDSWNAASATQICIHIVNSETFEAITGEKPPPSPITAYSYQKRGIPWFSNYGESTPGLPGAKAFKFLKSVLQIDKKRGIKDEHAEKTLSIRPEQVKHIRVPTMAERIEELRDAIKTSFEGQRFDACVRICTGLLDLVPRDSDALLARAKCYLEMGENYTAELDASDILETQSQNVEAYLVRAQANLNSGWVANAINDAAAAVKLAPTNQRAQELFSVAMKSRRR